MFNNIFNPVKNNIYKFLYRIISYFVYGIYKKKTQNKQKKQQIHTLWPNYLHLNITTNKQRIISRHIRCSCHLIPLHTVSKLRLGAASSGKNRNEL